MSRPAAPLARPRAARGPPIRVRRFGRNDFERFDEEAARGSHLCVGSASIGKVDIDCKYHWKKAQWGVLGNDRRPAGIVYMDITFRQPHGYWLECASVFITLSEDAASYALVAPHRWKKQPRRRGDGSSGSDYTVQLTEHYGPRYLTGRKTTASESRATRLTPSIGVAGVDVGGMGFESSTSHERAGRWTFRGLVGRPKGGFGLRTLQWELSENALDPDQAHSQEYHTAFAFEHSQRPVFMRVEVEGKLRSRGRQLKHDWLAFSSWSRRRDHSTLTHMDFGGAMAFDKSLDALARGLDKAMQEENVDKGPVEVPDPMPALFAPERASPAPTMPPPRAGQRIDDGRQPAAEGSRGRVAGQEDPILLLLNRRSDPRVANGDLAARVRLQEADAPPPAPQTPEHDDTASTAIDSEPSGSEDADEAVYELLKIPAILFILRFFVLIARCFSNPPPPPRHPASVEAGKDYGPGRGMLGPSPFRLRHGAGGTTAPALSRTLLPAPEMERRRRETVLRTNPPARIGSW